MHKQVILIPAYQPTEKLTTLLEELKINGFNNIVIVDDGSGASCSAIFAKAKGMGCMLVRHTKNMGKGAALKTGIKFAYDNFDLKHGIITADADGQHKVSDIIKVSEALKLGLEALILGTRDFGTKNVPLKSYLGNKITALVFKSNTGVLCTDTQTGLRGIPINLIDTASQTEGLRYEYEYNFLIEAAKLVGLHSVAIETIYFDKNAQSHFRPVRDSLLIYQRPIKFIASSFIGFITDIFLFFIISFIFSLYLVESIILATVISRVLSGMINYIINKKSVFRLQGNTTISITKYFMLFFLIMSASAIGTTGINMLLENPVLSKIIVDIALFFFSYSIQKNWVFVKKMNKRQISKVWKACATMFFIGYVSFTLLNRFVISQNVVNLDDINTNIYTEQSTTPDEESAQANIPEAETQTVEHSAETDNTPVESEPEIVEPKILEPIITENSYIDENTQITISTIREYDTDIYIAEIIVSDSSQLMAGLAQNSFGTNVKEQTSVIAEENDAIIAINGDYYGFRDYGYVMRNGYLYRDIATNGGNEDLVIFSDGTMEIINENLMSAQEIAELGAVQIFSFGPGLISNNEITVSEQSKVPREDENNPRTAIAMIEPNRYIFMVADGRTDESEGLSLYEMALVLSEYDCEVAYNLDGGGSATMVFMGEVVNNPTTNGRTFKERSVSDIVYIGN